MANPVIDTLRFEIDADQDKYIDLSQCAGLVNRKAFRQGLLWSVSGFTMINAAGAAGRIRIEKLPDHWIMANAWVSSFYRWLEQERKASSESATVLPKFHDFKIYMDSVHHDRGFAANAIPTVYGNNAFALGDWDASKIAIPNTSNNPGTSTEREFVAVGQNYPGNSAVTGLNAVSLIEGYAARRRLPYETDPNVPADSDDVSGASPENWMQAISNDGNNQDAVTLENLITENTQAPYPFEGDGNYTDTMYPYGANNPLGVTESLQMHDFTDVAASTVGNRTFMRGGVFQCGLIKVSNDTGAKLEMMIHLVPAHRGHKEGRGYLAMPMQEVN